MKIIIHHHECEYPIDLNGQRGPEWLLDDLLDSFQPDEVRQIINQHLELFRGLCDAWNQRELAARRQIERSGEKEA